MQFNPHDLKEKLLKALDKDQNVVDLHAVQEVFTKLEKFPITKETLEQTRIGKTVNDLRKKTANKNLAKRAKNLVRKWQVLITPTNNNSNSNTPPVNGEGLGNKGSSSSKLGTGAGPPGPHFPSHVLQGHGSKPVSPASRPGTPLSAGVISSSSSPGLVRPSSASSRVSPKAAAPALLRGGTPSSPALVTSTPISTPATAKAQFVAGLPPDTPRSHLHTDNTASSKNHIASKKRRRNQDNTPSPVLPNKRLAIDDSPNGTAKSKASLVNGTSPPDKTTNGSSVNTEQPASSFPMRKNPKLSIRASSIGSTGVDVSSPLERLASSSVCSDNSGMRTPINSSRTPKVKTTAELIQHLATRNELRLDGCETVAKIAQNRIEKEHEEEVSIVPAGAKPRPRRTPGATLPNTSDSALSKTKNEMVQKFLESSVVVSASQTDLSSMMHLNGISNDSQLLRDTSPVNSSNNVDSGHASLNSLHEETVARVGTPVKEIINSKAVRATKPISTTAEADTNSSRDPTVLYLTQQYPHLSGLSDEEILKCVSDDPFSLLPISASIASNIAEVTDDEPCSPPPPPAVSDSDVEKLHTQPWQGVNGIHDHKHNWHDWRDTLSAPTYNEDLLHILPYVDIDVDPPVYETEDGDSND